MLSKAAEAALLKTLEEPPPHVVFVLATTDPQKVSDTIRSRTQHLQFHLLPMRRAGRARPLGRRRRRARPVDEAALDAALAQGGGSARDTLSALELLAIAGGDVGDVIDARRVRRGADRARPGPGAHRDGATPSALGRDPRALTEDIVRHLRNGVPVADGARARAAAGRPGRRDRRAGPAARRRRRSCGRSSGSARCSSSMRHAPDPAHPARGRARAAHPRRASATTARHCTARIERLEHTVAQLRDAAASRRAPAPEGPDDRARRARRCGPSSPTASGCRHDRRSPTTQSAVVLAVRRRRPSATSADGRRHAGSRRTVSSGGCGRAGDLRAPTRGRTPCKARSSRSCERSTRSARSSVTPPTRGSSTCPTTPTARSAASTAPPSRPRSRRRSVRPVTIELVVGGRSIDDDHDGAPPRRLQAVADPPALQSPPRRQRRRHRRRR